MTTNQVTTPNARKPTMPVDPSSPPDSPPPTPNGVNGTTPCSLLLPLSKLDQRPHSIPLKKIKPRRLTTSAQPVLRFSLKAWLKLQLLCHAGDTEIGAFAITSDDDPLYVIDLITIKQSCTCISVEFDDAAVADFFDEQVDAGRSPEQFFRIWAHTHPGDSPQPSCTDEETFQRVFGTCDWAVMFILARGGATYCRLRVNSGGNYSGHDKAKGRSISLATTIPCDVDHASIVSDDFELPLDQWIEEYKRNVSVEAPPRGRWWQDEQLPLGEAMDLSQIDDDLVDELMGLDDEALQSLMEALDEQTALRGQLQEVADAK